MEQKVILFKDIADELVKMEEKDQQSLIEENDEEFDRIRKIQPSRLKEIISQIGWPTISRVGIKASHAAWIIAQHADHDLEFQKQCLQLLKECLEGEVMKDNVAYLEDRTRTNQGLPQLFGTQVELMEGADVILKPVEDIESLDKRRQNMGLGPITKYKEGMKKLSQGKTKLGNKKLD